MVSSRESIFRQCANKPNPFLQLLKRAIIIRINYLKFGQNPVSSLGGDVLCSNS